ncbi:hypothetical protein P3T76_010751 [Phytophthora citrophthora]|uniref:WW domain-containing protein n=1 Tax=Phytophthora citrophthora TaxID=4793 RepID=A0AAD9LFY7_9STRA|nr:hypothetical protein P3T76_010751 [Phytophthora citrophthora]
MADADQGAESTRPSSSADGVTNVQGGGANSTANPASNDTAFVAEEAVGDSLWVRKWDEASNQLYYFNLRTQESSWDEPAAYKAVLMSEPINMDTERAQTAEGSVKDPQQDEGQHNSASVAIQSLYRGRKDRKRVEEARKWTEQFDPTTSQKYYYNSDTGESQWEKPVDFLVGIKDERSARAVKIQTVFRAKKARDRVKQLADEEEEEEDLKQQVRDVDEAVAAEEKKLAILTADRSDQEQWCEYYDPRSSKYYYRHSGTNEITWEKPEKYVSSSAEGSSKRDVAALSIQCAARKRIAAKDVASKREKLRVLTDPDTMQLKLDELKQVSVEIQAEIDHRTLVSMNEEQQFPHLSSLLSGWRESLESIKSHVVSLENRGEDIKMAECLAARLDHAERFHKSLAEMRSNCLALLRGILLMNSYFVDLDVSRINTAFATFAKWKSHELCALKDSRLLEILQGSDISLLLERAETLLRHAMGLTDFTTGTTSSTGKRYEDWHPSVAAAVVSIRELEESLEQKTQLLRGYRTAESRKKEISQMTEEDLLAARIVQMQRRRLNDEKDHAMFLVKCQEFWKKGLNQREEDIRAALGKSKTLRRPKHREVPQIDLSSGLGNDNKAKLSIWEATKEGLPVEAVRALVFAEMQKARRLGYDFLVKTSRSDHGETLIQIACWWGHTVRSILLFVSCGCLTIIRGSTWLNSFWKKGPK